MTPSRSFVFDHPAEPSVSSSSFISPRDVSFAVSRPIIAG